jgi:hypothetical protein
MGATGCAGNLRNQKILNLKMEKNKKKIAGKFWREQKMLFLGNIFFSVKIQILGMFASV